MRYSKCASAQSFLVGMLFAASCLAQQNTSVAPVDTASTPGAVPVLVGPKPKPIKVDPTRGAQQLFKQDKEGWVTLQMMIDPNGKPYEVTVTGSSGDDSFRNEALKAIQGMQFEPGRVAGEPVSSSLEMKLKFGIPNRPKGARSEFVRTYKALVGAVSAGDRALADSQLSQLKPDNLYEDAYFGLAVFNYSVKWGTPAQQLMALQRARANERKPTFLPKTTFEGLLVDLFRLQVKANLLADALDTDSMLRDLPADPKTLAAFKPVVDAINTMRTNDAPIAVAGVVGVHAWQHHLFRKHFQLLNISGNVAELKLRCERRYVAFPFDPTLQYTVSEKSGACRLEVVGDVGTTFTLVET